MANHCNMSSTSSTAPMSTPSPVPRKDDISSAFGFGTGSHLAPGTRPGHVQQLSPSPLPPAQINALVHLHPVSPHHHYNQYNRGHPERPRQVVRIFTSEFPQYFAVITRNRQEIHDVGPAAGMLESTIVPNTRINIKAKYEDILYFIIISTL